MSEQQIYAKCAWRLIPFMMVLYVANFFDRVNVGFAALTMNRDLHFSPSVYGFGAGVFFVGMVVFSVPSSLMVEKLGAKRWIAAILAIWGLISAATAFVQSPLSFYTLRFLLGVAEAGFVPGLILYLSYWFPPAHRARFTAIFLTAAPVSFILGGPLSSLILDGTDGLYGVHGWQWLFLAEGLPASALAFGVLKILPDAPAHAPWLTAEEKKAIARSLAKEDLAEHRELWRTISDPRVLALGLVNAGVLLGIYGSGLWLPQIVRAMGFSTLATGFVVALPYLATMGPMILWGRSSDAKGERIRHIALAALIAAAGFALAGFTASNLVSLIGLTFGVMGAYAILAPLISLPSEFLGGTAAAGGIALVYAIANLGSFLGPFTVGVLSQQSGGYSSSMIALALALALSAALALALGRAIAPRAAMIKTVS